MKMQHLIRICVAEILNVALEDGMKHNQPEICQSLVWPYQVGSCKSWYDFVNYAIIYHKRHLKQQLRCNETNFDLVFYQ